MESFTPFASLLGGALIGLAATLLLAFNGRIAGISGILANALEGRGAGGGWRWAFLAGLVGGGLALSLALPEGFVVGYDRSLLAIAAAGLLVGVGVRLGSGCTSGHGVCGISRFSARSIVATLTFITTGAVTVVATRLLTGSGS